MRKILLIAASSLLLVAVPGYAQDSAADAAAVVAKADAAVDVVTEPTVPATGKIIFFRKGGLMGAAISCAVFEKGAKVNSLPPGKFFEIDATEGVHEYTVRSEATDTLRIEVEAGETYYNECSIGMGIMAGRPNLSPVDVARWDQKKGKLKPAKPNKPE
jgi:hypothetical protein